MSLQFFGGFAACGAISGDIPTALPPARYAVMVQKSPFALATAINPVAATPSFAVNLYLTGVGKIGNDDVASIASRDQQQPRFTLFSSEASKDGISLVSVDWSDELGKGKVTIKKGTEFATLEFDQATLQSAPQPAAGVPVPPMPGQPNNPNQQVNGRRIILPSQPGQPNPNGQQQSYMHQPSVGQPAVNLPPPVRQRQRIISANPGQ